MEEMGRRGQRTLHKDNASTNIKPEQNRKSRYEEEEEEGVPTMPGLLFTLLI